MNKKVLVTLGVIGGVAAGAWYFMVPPQIKITQVDQLGKKVKFLYGGKEITFDYSNPALALALPNVRGFSTSVKANAGTSPFIIFTTTRGSKMVGTKLIDLNKSVTS